MNLELVSDLVTDFFSFKMFAARRDLLKEELCDNAANASNVLKQLQQAFDRSRTALESYAASSGVNSPSYHLGRNTELITELN